jgi:hypothetical protein
MIANLLFAKEVDQRPQISKIVEGRARRVVSILPSRVRKAARRATNNKSADGSRKRTDTVEGGAPRGPSSKPNRAAEKAATEEFSTRKRAARVNVVMGSSPAHAYGLALAWSRLACGFDDSIWLAWADRGSNHRANEGMRPLRFWRLREGRSLCLQRYDALVA